MKRMQREYQDFWSPDRRHKAEAMGLTPNEVQTLASIVDEETNDLEEKHIIAGLYYNRLHEGNAPKGLCHNKICLEAV